MKKQNNLLNILTSDFYKLSRLKSIYIAPAIMVLLILINYALFWTQNVIFDATGVPPGLPDLLIKSKDLLMSASSFISIGLFMSIILGIMIGGEFSNGIVKINMARGADRHLIYLSKWIVAVVLTVFYVLFSFIVCGILSGASGFETPFTAHDAGILFRNLTLQILANASVTSIVLMICYLIRSKGASIGVNLLIYFLSSVVFLILISIGQLSPKTAWTGKIASIFPSQILQLACQTRQYSAVEIAKLIVSPLCFIGFSYLMGTLSFAKRDVK